MNSFTGSSSAHGFSTQLIVAAVEESASIFSIADLLKRLPVFNIYHAKMILEIFQEAFEDIGRFDDTVEIVAGELYSFLPIAMDNELFLGSTSDQDSDIDPDAVNVDERENW